MDYKKYLQSIAKVPENQIPYYCGWVTQFLQYCNKKPGQTFDSTELHSFLDLLGRRCEDWQVEQARKAIELYRYLHSRKGS